MEAPISTGPFLPSAIYPTPGAFHECHLWLYQHAAESPEGQGAEYAVLAFDAPGPTFRHEVFGEYKANRPSMPEDLRVQIPPIKEIGLRPAASILEREGYEADDLIATLARKLEREEIETVIVSGDKDLMQLISSHVTNVRFHERQDFPGS